MDVYPIDKNINILKNILFQKYVSNKTYSEIAKISKISKSKVGKIVRLSNDGQIDEAIILITGKKNVVKFDVPALSQVMDNQSYKNLTLRDIWNKYNNKTNKKVKSLETVRKYLTKVLKYTYSKAKVVYEKVLTSLYRRMRVQASLKFIDLIQEYKHFIFIDESSFNIQNSKMKVWSRVLEDRIVPSKSKGKNITLISAITKSGLINYEIFDGVCNAIRFVDFLRDTCLEYKKENLNIDDRDLYLFFDNVNFHKNMEVRNLAEKQRFNILYNAPYSADFHCIESYFGHLKRLRRHTIIKSE